MKLRNLISKCHLIVLYPFRSKHGKAFTRWYITDSEKKRYKYDDLKDDSIVFDVGGYYGDFSDGIIKKYNCYSYIFEPAKEFYEKIVDRFEDNPKVKVYNFGLSDKSKDERMSISKDGSSTAIDRHSNEYQLVSMRDIKEFCDECGIVNIDLLKLNIEGGEYSLFNRMIECNMLSIVNHFQIQFHDIETDSFAKMTDIQQELQKTHSLEWSCRPYVWESWKRREAFEL